MLMVTAVASLKVDAGNELAASTKRVRMGEGAFRKIRSYIGFQRGGAAKLQRVLFRREPFPSN
jgi:hypothetical protein